MASLEARAFQLVGARSSVTTIAVVGEGRGAIGRSAGDFVHAHLTLEAVGQASDHHAEMEKHSMGGKDRRFLAAMLASRRGEDAADTADQGVPRPDTACLIEEVFHLRRHVAEACRRADDDRVIVRQLRDGRNRCMLVALVPRLDGYGLRHDFGNPLQRDRGAGGARALGNGRRHRLDMTIG